MRIRRLRLSAISSAGASVPSVVHVASAGVGSTLPAASIARTARLCGPGLSPVRVWGEVQVVKAAVSRLHWKLVPASLAEKAMVTLLPGAVLPGAESIVVSG